jgi:hypothetical protein
LRLLRAAKSDTIEAGSLVERCWLRTIPLFLGYKGRRLVFSLGGLKENEI